MSYVHDLRTTLVFALAAATQLALGLLFRADPAFSDIWLLPFSVGVLLSLLLLDGVQRRWRGDPRTRSTDPDARTLATAIVGLLGLALVGAWSFSQGHQPMVWTILGGGGLVGAATLVLAWYLAASGAEDWPQ